jgi:hypothetical protein
MVELAAVLRLSLLRIADGRGNDSEALMLVGTVVVVAATGFEVLKLILLRIADGSGRVDVVVVSGLVATAVVGVV